MRTVVVTGVGAVTPLGIGADQLHAGWVAGKCAIVGGQAPCSDFDPADFLTIKESRRADRFTQFAMVAGDEALTDAGWEPRADLPYPAERVGCVLGTGIGGIDTFERGKDLLYERGPDKVPPLVIPLMMPNAASAALAIRYGVRGQSFSVASACAAGTHAIGSALRMIEVGDADAVITGGSEAALTPLACAAFGSLDALSASGRSLPFDARRDGFVLGEGGGILILEDAELAAKRGARVLAVVRGYGATSDAFHLTAPDSDGTGAMRSIEAALANAKLTPKDISYINAHGTATPLNDRIETIAIKRAFGDHAYQTPVSSTKSAIGHLLGAAGAVEAIATIYALRGRVAPPTLGWEQADEGMDLDYVPLKARPLATNGKPPVGLSNSFGFGGHNAVLCLEAV